MQLVTLGEVLIDMFPAEVGRSLTDVSAFHPKPGGAPANVAVAAQRLGAPAAFIGKVGDDLFGHYLIDVLDRQGVETRGMRVDAKARTTMAIIALPDEHTAEFVFYRNPGADQRLRPDELDRDLLASTRAFHFGSLSLTDEPVRSATQKAVALAREAGALISYDVNYRPALWPSPQAAVDAARAMLPHVDVLKVNETELALLAGRDARELLDEDAFEGLAAGLLAAGPTVVVVTRGQAGSAYFTAEGGGIVRAFQVRTVDSVGCGDAFIAGLLTRLTAVGAPGLGDTGALRDAVRYASAVGALTATRQGVIPALPTAAEVDVFLHERA